MARQDKRLAHNRHGQSCEARIKEYEYEYDLTNEYE